MGLASVDIGAILVERQIPTESHRGPQAVLARIAALVKKMAPEGVQSLGFGVPGLLNLKDGATWQRLQFLRLHWPARFLRSTMPAWPRSAVWRLPAAGV